MTSFYDSDELITDDEQSRNGLSSPPAHAEFTPSPGDSAPDSNDNTPTAFQRNGTIRQSPRGKITQWTPQQCANFVSELGPDYVQYGSALIDEAMSGDALVIVQHDELRELGIVSIGHRLTILKAIYNLKKKQDVPLEPDHYVPLSAEAASTELRPTAEDITAIIHQIKLRDSRIIAAEVELKTMKEHLDKVWEDTRRLREDMLPVARAVKENSQPLPPAPDPPHIVPSIVHAVEPVPSPKGPPPMPPMINLKPSEGLSRSLSKKLSTKRFPFGTTAKSPAPVTIHEGTTLEAAQAMTSSHLTPNSNTYGTSQQVSPTSPPFNMTNSNTPSRNNADAWAYSNTSSMNYDSRAVTPSIGAPPTRRAPHPNPNTATISIANSTDPSTRLSAVTTDATSSFDFEDTHTIDRFKVREQMNTAEVLPLALRKWRLTGDPRYYNLYIVYADRERLMTSQERPLVLFKELQKANLHPMFMLRKVGAKAEEDGVGGNGMGMGMGTAQGSRAQSYISPVYSEVAGGQV